MKEKGEGATWTWGDMRAGIACAKALRQEVGGVLGLEELQGGQRGWRGVGAAEKHRT